MYYLQKAIAFRLDNDDFEDVYHRKRLSPVTKTINVIDNGSPYVLEELFGKNFSKMEEEEKAIT